MGSLRESRHGRLVTITGPVLSGKKTYLERLLNSAHGTIWKKGKNHDTIVLAKHPKDGARSPGKIRSYNALETTDPDEIADLIKPNTEAVMISGINFFPRKIIDLLQAVVASNRLVYVSGLNLNWKGEPYNFMPEIMALSDEILLTRAPCMEPGCQRVATRSEKIDERPRGRRRVCIDDHDFKGRPSPKHFLKRQTGGLELFVGNMFASKSTTWRERMRELDANGIEYVVFKWLKDKRYKERDEDYVPFGKGEIGFNNSDEKIPAITVRNMDDILKYLDGETRIKEVDEKSRKRKLGHVFIDEGQFIAGISEKVRERMYQGYKFYITGLMRDFRMLPFKEMANLLALADTINIMHAYCVLCGREASESQRLVKKNGKWSPAHFKGDKVVVGGKGEGKTVTDAYEARCIDCIKVSGAPKPKYIFQRYKPPKTRKEARRLMREMQ
jgi:thymidine kinase